MTPVPDGLESGRESGRDFSDSKGYYDAEMCGLHGHDKASVLLTNLNNFLVP